MLILLYGIFSVLFLADAVIVTDLFLKDKEEDELEDL